ncbi:PIN-like domain-containing protein [Priestia megaterium]|uniref:PIN-like domain-containing protein n=1 Tax=Priestia megaterium TaxID=1404 RepID=UPI000BFDD9F4|nr:PIN-like domain-containing protein [Priestia megaterium]PGR79740.1 hypothetical protein COC53_26465 [Priestia megaterium]
MKDLFIGFYRPSEEDYKELWENCHFVFDANMLLNVYRYSELARETFIKIFQQLNERIWIPHQVGIEYHFHMLEEIKGQEKKYDELQNIIKTKRAEIEEEYKNFSLRHSNLKMDEKLLKKLQDSINDICKDLENQKENHPDLNITKDEIMKVFTNKVGSPYDQERIEEIEAEGEIRYNRKQPPGFKDSKKGGSRYHDERVYQQKYGDLIVWNQLIDYSKEKDVPIIFVTDDRKDDWWNIISGERVGPSPQLLQEFKRKTEGNKFYMYQPKQFLSFINTFLNIGIEKKTIEAAIQNIDDYKKQVEKSPSIVIKSRFKKKDLTDAVKFKELAKSYYKETKDRDRDRDDKLEFYKKEFMKNINLLVENDEVINDETSITSYFSKYLLVIKYPNKNLDTGINVVNKVRTTLKELLPSNEIDLHIMSMGTSTITMKINIFGRKPANPNLITVFLDGRLGEMGCSIESFDKLD